MYTHNMAFIPSCVLHSIVETPSLLIYIFLECWINCKIFSFAHFVDWTLNKFFQNFISGKRWLIKTFGSLYVMLLIKVIFNRLQICFGFCKCTSKLVMWVAWTYCSPSACHNNQFLLFLPFFWATRTVTIDYILPLFVEIKLSIQVLIFNCLSAFKNA